MHILHMQLPALLSTYMERLKQVEHTSLPFCAPTWKGLGRERMLPCPYKCLHENPKAGRENFLVLPYSYMEGQRQSECASLHFCARKGLGRERTPSCLSMCLHRRVKAGRQHVHTFLCTNMERLRQEEHTSLPYRAHTWKGKGRGNRPSGPSLYPSGGQGQDGNSSLSLHVEDQKPGAKQQKYRPGIIGKLR